MLKYFNYMAQQCEKDEWIIVGKPKRKQIKKQKNEGKPKNGKIVWQMGKPLYIKQNQEDDIQQFINSPSFRINRQILQIKMTKELQKRKINHIHIECLGLGDFLKYAKPRYQFFFLKNLLIPLCKSFSPQKITVNCYDPVFSQQCIEQLKKIGTLIPDNIPVQENKIFNILFMPHCERFLYERYCRIYKSGEVLIIGNSLKEYKNRCELISQKVPQCFLNRFHLQQTKIKDFRQSMNDTYCYFI